MTNKGGDMTAIFKNNCTDQFDSPHGGIPPLADLPV